MELAILLTEVLQKKNVQMLILMQNGLLINGCMQMKKAALQKVIVQKK